MTANPPAGRLAGPVPPGHPWDAAAVGWDAHGPLIEEWLHDVTLALLDGCGIGIGSRVLDIAAGAGGQTLAIARRSGSAGRVLATDISPQILALAHQKLHRAGLDGMVSTLLADAERLDLADAKFDAAVSRLGLMFCRRPLAALEQAWLALRPGGRFGAVVFAAPAGNPCITIMATTALRHAGLPAALPFAPGTLLSLGQPGLMAELMLAAGFVDIDVRSVSAPMRLPSRTHYIDFARSAAQPIIALLAALPDQAQRDAWDDIALQLDHFSVPDGWHGPNELLLCFGARPDGADLLS